MGGFAFSGSWATPLIGLGGLGLFPGLGTGLGLTGLGLGLGTGVGIYIFKFLFLDLYSGLSSWSTWSTSWGTPFGKALVDAQAKQYELFKQELERQVLAGNTGNSPGGETSEGTNATTGNSPGMNAGMQESPQMQSSRSQRTHVLKDPSAGTGPRTVNGINVIRLR